VKVLQVNKFFYYKGGAEYIFFDTIKLLKKEGHAVIPFSMIHPHNLPSSFSKYFVSFVDLEGKNMSLMKKIRNAGRIFYSFEAKRKLNKLIDKEKPDIAHLHNIHHQISPSILHVLKKKNIPMVMTLHDYKMVCPVYMLLSRGRVCERCKDGRYYWCMINRCTKNSYLKSLFNVIEMYLHHKLLHIFELVDVFISPSRFLKEKIEEMGFKGKIIHLPNFLNPDLFEPFYGYKEKAIYYAGRLSEEKGLRTLIEAVKGLNVQLKVIGEGPLRMELEKIGGKNIYFMGYLPLEELKKVARDCIGMVIPSECYENNPRSVMEAFALGKPVIGARIGGIPELIKDGETGFLFEPGNVEDLREKITKLVSLSSAEIKQMGQRARHFVEENFNPESHYQKLMEIYDEVITLS